MSQKPTKIQPNDSNGKEKNICKKTRDRTKSFL
jgi:hypothetical protein